MKSELQIVHIIMATYNGEKYLEQQLESIKNQIEVAVKLLIVDDGSTDSTLEILEKYKTTGLVERIIHTNRIGPSLAFQTGLRHLESAIWLGFSDQDDIWDSTKLINAIKVSIFDEPTLVSGGRTYINNKGKIVGHSIELRRQPNWKNALVENVCYGNTILLNAKGVHLIKKFDSVNPLVFDAWLYLVFALMGRVLYLKDSGTKYRLHETNAVGIGKTWKFKSLIENQQKLIMNGFLIKKYMGEDLESDFTRAISKYEKHLNRSVLRNLLAPLTLVIFRQRITDNIMLKAISPWIYSRFN
jgi:glycosyltransferase involved in cell wall biosynthesis